MFDYDRNATRLRIGVVLAR
ncbi:hypothetical protein [Sphingobium sp. MI1205]